MNEVVEVGRDMPEGPSGVRLFPNWSEARKFLEAQGFTSQEGSDFVGFAIYTKLPPGKEYHRFVRPSYRVTRRQVKTADEWLASEKQA